jgi:starch synthase
VTEAPVVYSANARLGGGGLGSSVAEILGGLYDAGLLRQVIASSCKSAPVPLRLLTTQGAIGRMQKRLAAYDPTGWSDYLCNRIFDLWAGRIIQSSRLFESWTTFCITSLQQARQRSSQTVLMHGSTHPRTQFELINAERQAWGLPPLREMPSLRQVEREMALADTIVVQSSFARRSLVERGLPPGKLRTIPLGVHVERFTPADDRPARPFRALFVGQVTLRKGVQYLLEAWKRLGWHDVELWLVGRVLSDCKPVLRHYADLPGLKIVGHIADPLSAFQACDVFVAPSVEDGFGLVILEAMACGLPVVVSNQAGAADAVCDGENGFVVRFDDAAGYAAALERLRADPARARRMGKAGRAAAQRYTWDVCRKAMVDLHLELLADAEPRHN